MNAFSSHRNLPFFIYFLVFYLSIITLAFTSEDPPVYEWVRTNNLEAVQNYVEAGGDLQLTNPYGETLVFAAVETGSLGIVQYLLDKGAPISSDGLLFEHPLEIAAKNNRMDIVELLIEYGASPETAIHSAAASGNLELLKYFLNLGVDVNHFELNKKSALGEAARQGNFEMVDYLLEQGAEVNLQYGQQNTALIDAVNYMEMDMAWYLIENGADIHIENHTGTSALDYMRNYQDSGIDFPSELEALLKEEEPISWTPFDISVYEPYAIFTRDEETSVYGLRINLVSGYNKQVFPFDFGIINKAEEAGVIEIGIMNIIHEMYYGLQVGIFGNYSAYGYGIQIGGFFNASQFGGIQVSGLGNVGGCYGLQVSLINLGYIGMLDAEVMFQSYGIQIGGVNIFGEIAGLEIGIVNVVHQMNGVQIGAVNYVMELDASAGLQIGLLNMGSFKGLQLGIVNSYPPYILFGIATGGYDWW